MNRPCVDELLKPLKPFQRRTVELAFHRLFIAEDSIARFLVADEVGLGSGQCNQTLRLCMSCEFLSCSFSSPRHPARWYRGLVCLSD